MPTRPVAIIVLLLLANAAHAHSDDGGALGFLSGARHPVSGMDHILAMIAVGLWGAQLGAPAIWLLPVAFPMAMALGGMLGLMGVRLPGVEIGIALSAIALGTAVACAWRPALWMGAVLVGFFALFHGHAHGVELPAGASGLTYSIGFVVVTGLLHALGIALGLIHHWPAGRITLRVAGGAIGIAGIFFLIRALG